MFSVILRAIPADGRDYLPTSLSISVSLNLGQVPDEPWALYVKGAAGTAEALLRPGDVLLYRGIDLIHWRHAYEGRHLAQVFLHYVDRNGPHRDEKFDRRPALGTAGVR